MPGPCWLLPASLSLGIETCSIVSKLEWNGEHRCHLPEQNTPAQRQQKHKAQGRSGSQALFFSIPEERKVEEKCNGGFNTALMPARPPGLSPITEEGGECGSGNAGPMVVQVAGDLPSWYVRDEKGNSGNSRNTKPRDRTGSYSKADERRSKKAFLRSQKIGSTKTKN